MAEPAIVLGPMGPFIHVGQRNSMIQDAVDGFRAQDNWALWWIGEGRADLAGSGRLDLPAAVLMQPDGRSELAITAGSTWMRLVFDVVHQRLRRGKVGATRVHSSGGSQPDARRAFGVAMPTVLPADLVVGAKELLDDCLAWWWRSDLDLYRANCRLGLWLAETAKRFAGAAPVAAPDDWFARCRERVRDRLELGLTTADLARAVGMSPDTLRHRFVAEVGEEPGAWLTRQRFERARELLATTVWRIEDVARMAGFASRTTFSTRFRERYGASPGAWRRRNRR